jgi:hypothetical protein
MRVKFTIAICALLVLGLAVSQVNAQGYQVRVRPNNVVEHGNNQELGAIRLTHRTLQEAGANIVENGTIEITFDGLTITNPSTALTSGTDPDGDEQLIVIGGAATAKAANDDDTDVGKVTITITTHGDTLTLSGIRADVSGLEAGDRIMATISATGSGDGFSDIGETSGASISGLVSTVADGITVTAVGQISVLTCDADTTSGRMPSIKVEEGFNAAWETGGIGDTDTQIRVVVANVPTGVTFRWPGQGNEGEDGTAGTSDDLTAPAAEGEDDNGYFGNPATHDVDHDDNDDTADESVAALMYVSSGGKLGEDATKHWAVYSFQGVSDNTGTDLNHDDVKNVFTIAPMVMVDTDKTGMGGVSDAWAQLWPEKDDDAATKLSYATPVETKDEGYFVNVTECVTYLLFPFLTCGAQADWTTGIAVANTSLDDDAFPVNDGAAAQGGSVMIHAYPKSTAAEKAAVGHNSSPDMLADPISTGISGNLAAGDSVAITCNMHPMLAGFEGYAIVRAAFRHAHGMAFVLGNFMDGAAIDVAHGYIALVIPDPEFAGTDGSPIGRGAVSGETLGH